jgi:hypothetical protein
MAVISPQERLDKWDRKFDTARIKTVLDGEKPTMKTHAGIRFAELTAMEDATKAVLNAADVERSDTGRYLCFAREVWRADRTYEGPTLRSATAEVLGKWVAQGLQQSVLETIRDQVFTIGPPTPAP